MKTKVAIVGCATRSRDEVNYDDPDLDIWVFNESAQKEWCKRADAVLQLHEPSIWKNPLNRSDKGHGEWLMSGNTPPVYMLEKYPEVPKAIRLPREDIVDTLLPNFTVDSERGRKDYFTSTIAYAIALATYLGYQEIHTYGVELADESEYREQQPAAMFWTGIAIGRGVKFVSHSLMFDCPLYPLETFIGLPLDTFSAKIVELDPQIKAAQDIYLEAKKAAEEAIHNYQEVGSGKDEMIVAIRKQVETAQKFGILDGAKQENERYYGRAQAMKEMSTTYVFSRHEFMRDQAAIGVRRNQTIDEFQQHGTSVQTLIDQIEPKKFDSLRRRQFIDLRNAVETFVKLGVAVGMYTGAINEDGRFMQTMQDLKDKQNVNYQRVCDPCGV